MDVDVDTLILSALPSNAPDIDTAPLGGRMQALAVAACLALENALRREADTDALRVTILAAGTDGRDGPTDACGAIVDVFTATAARENGRDPAKDLTWLRSYHALNAAHALLKTGPTGTNVMDVVAAYIAPAVPQVPYRAQLSALR